MERRTAPQRRRRGDGACKIDNRNFRDSASPAKGAQPGQQADGGQGGDSDVEQMPAPPKRTETLTQATPYPEGNWEELVERIITVSKDDKHDGRLVATVRWYAIPPPRSPARVGIATNG